MDTDSAQEKFYPILRQYWLPIVLVVVGLMFLGYGMIQSFSKASDKPDILFEAASTSNVAGLKTGEESASRQSEKQIVVDVEGAVEKPGVYKLRTDARVHDALIAAGGMSRDADREQVAKRVNLAGKVIDGGKIYIPFVGESPLVPAYQGENQVVLSDTGGLININSATESQLDSLPGIGPVTSQKIIANRTYSKIEELLEKKVVGSSVFEKIRGKITVQ